MSFRLGDFIVQDIMYGLASKISTNESLYVLTQLSEAQIAVTADSNDITDKDGNVVVRQYRAKQGEFTATNAFMNANVIGAAGATTKFASSSNVQIGPKMIVVSAADGTAVLENVVAGSIVVDQYFADGALGKKYELGVSASETEFAVTTGSTTIYNFTDVTAAYVLADAESEFPSTGDATKTYVDKTTGKAYTWDSDNTQYVENTGVVLNIVATLPTTGVDGGIYVVTGDNTVHTCSVTTTPDGTTTVTLPTDPEAAYFFIRYKRTFTSGAVITNSSKEFPSSVNMLLKVKYVDPCNKDLARAAYIEMPSFKMSPEQTLTFNPESPTMDINATLETDYCSKDKELFTIYFVDEEDDE